MKKLFLLLVLLSCTFMLNAQTNISVDVYDSIYEILDNAQLRGLCSTLPGAKPYTEKKILSALDEILEKQDQLLPAEIQIINDYIEKCKRNDEENKKKLGTVNFYNDTWSSVPMSFQINYALKTNASVGIYNESDYTSYGFDFMPTFGFSGDIGDKFGYNIQGILDATKMPLHKDGTYNVGTNWFSYIGTDGEPVPERTKPRDYISYSNNNYLPFSYIKPWGGQVYFLSNLSASGLEGWAHELGFTGNILAELHGNLLNDRINLGVGRIYREWAAMDTHSSLILNASAMPFMGFDMTFEILPFLTYSSLTGSLEYPNRDDIFDEKLPGNDQDDASLWQNAFSINMVEVNVKGIHADFGSSCVWPKRFELAYLFPLTNYVEYQNHLGDYDNLALFGDLKYTKEGLGSIWGSLYLDEINGMNNNPFSSMRAMFAAQAGIKAVLPKVPFGTLALRYTKIEPYCYTHHSVNYVPWYDDYVCMNYTNNGICLGSYLPPNSDEILIRFDARPIASLSTSVSYQLIRHGAEYGSQQVRGSSIYSELDNKNRDDFTKCFLNDGAYNWIHILSFNGSYTSRQTKLPFKIDLTVGAVLSYFTAIDSSDYVSSDYWYNGEINNYGNSKGSFSFIDTDEYPLRFGPVISVGFTLGYF